MLAKSELENIQREGLLKLLDGCRVYQYAPFDIALNEILMKQSLQFSNPMRFNDPFDCNERLLKIDFNEEIVENIIKGLSKKYCRSEIRLLRRRLKVPLYQNQILREKRKEYKIYCFSEKNDEVLMWSHYAEKHQGISIGFDFPPHYEDHFILCPINYLEEITPIDGLVELNRGILYWLTTKSKRWEYEKEIRAITKSNRKEDYEYVNFDKKYIKEVIFGCNVEKKQIDNAKDLLWKNGFDLAQIEMKQMVIDESNFLLKERKLV